ncbi:DMT family transporter [Microcoleus sp. FACHB-1515]|uniref:DMT family transporter n=1 Tax=Cyanophyceae TaxID=3028117 RepID=UPI001683B8A2|nr:DMT family transporter [Microcoleus sp. FACHB-1515]MBD2089728.1 DMT family transporter [Microcoleus sp. FACHB-1515]
MSNPAKFLAPQTLLAGVGAAACWGISTVMSKGALAFFPPLTLLVVQLLCSNLLLWSIALCQKISLPNPRQMLRLGLPGFIQPGLSFTLGLIGLSMTSASVEALIWSTETLFIIGLAWFLLGERVSAAIVSLASLAVVGVVLVNTAGAETADSSLLGNVLILAATFCAALYTVLVRRHAPKTNSLLLVALNQAIGLAGVFVIWLLSLRWQATLNLTQIPWQIWLLAALSGILLHGLPFWLHTIVLRSLPAGLAALFLTLIPLFTIGGAFLFLHEQLTLVQWIGAALILAAMTAISRLESSS